MRDNVEVQEGTSDTPAAETADLYLARLDAYVKDEDPQAIRQGHDPQLEKAVAVLMEQLRQNPPKKYERPPFPNYHPQQ